MSDSFVDLEIIAEVDKDSYLVIVDKEDLAELVEFSEFVLRHWDGNKPVILERYSKDAVRTQEDAHTVNNLAELPRVTRGAVNSILD